jgi:hypothetical protein
MGAVILIRDNPGSRMEVGEQGWWNKDDGVRYWVEIVSTLFQIPPNQLLPTGELAENAIMIRVLEGVHCGMYAMVDSSHLFPVY